MEVLHFGYPKSMPDIAKAPDTSSPVLIAMAAKELAPFALEFVDTGLTVVPKCPHTKVGDGCAESILKGSGVEAKKLYDKGALYGQSIKDKSDYFILSECVPAGTTTAYAVVKAMGYECDGYFASSSAESSVKTLKHSELPPLSSNSLPIAKLYTKQPSFVVNMLTVLNTWRCIHFFSFLVVIY